MVLQSFGIVLTLLGATALYASAPLQKLLAPTASPKASRLVGWAVLALGLLALLFWAGPATAVFIWVTMATLAWSLVPLGAAWWRHRQETRP